MTNWLNIASVLIFILFAIPLFHKNRYWAFFFFFYTGQLWVVFSSLYIEQGIYITEQEFFSFETGSTYRLVMQNLIFFSSALIVLRLLPTLKDKKKVLIGFSRDNIITRMLLYFLFLFTFLYLIDAILTFIRFGQVFDRFNFYEYSILQKVPIVGKILSYVPFFSFILGVLYLTYKNDKKISYLIFLSLSFVIISSIIQGNKFSALYQNLLFFFIPISLTIKIKFNRKIIKYIVGVTLGLFIFLGVVWNLSLKEYSQTLNSRDAMDFVFYRVLGLQGHMWWGTDYYSSFLTEIDKDQNLQKELDVILLRNDGKYTSGLNSLMLMISPNIGATFIEQGKSFTMGFPALLSILFNQTGKIFMLIILGVIFGLFIYLFYKSIKSRDLLNTIILAYVYVFGIMQFFSMGRTFMLFNLKIYVLLLIYLFLTLITLTSNKNSKKGVIGNT